MLGYTTICSRSTDAPASAWWMKAITYAPPTPIPRLVITQLRPISVLFNLPQQELLQLNPAAAKGLLNVEAQRSDNDEVIDRGVLRVVDNQVDQTTGTVKLKAEFPNAELQLGPGSCQYPPADRHAQAGGGDP
jgi:multidrug efflux pump subunit AcrA (membrane-fusion protein)